MGSRRLRALLRGLPPESAFGRAIDPGTGWGYNEELLALVAQLIDQGNRLFYDRYRKKGSKAAEPIHIPRPGSTLDATRSLEKPRMASSDEVLAFFQGRRN